MVKVGDKIRVLVDGANFAHVKKGDEFIVSETTYYGAVYTEGRPSWRFAKNNYEVITQPARQDPIEYLKSAYADGDMINPVAMLRDCYGVTKTEHIVVEWSDAKPKIKVGDKVRVIGPLNYGQESIAYPYYSVGIVDRVDAEDIKSTYCIDGLWFPATSVERI